MSIDVEPKREQPGGGVPDITQTVNRGEVDQDIIEGGYVGEIGDLHWRADKHRAETARRLAFFFAWVLVISGIIHYALTAVVNEWGKPDTAKSLANIFNMWLPIISSLVSAAATYYFTREKQ